LHNNFSFGVKDPASGNHTQTKLIPSAGLGTEVAPVGKALSWGMISSIFHFLEYNTSMWRIKSLAKKIPLGA